MSTIRSRKVPIWKLRFQYAEKYLNKMLSSLKGLPAREIRYVDTRQLPNIELNEMDFETGFIRRGIRFFKPRVDGTCKVSNTGRDPDNEGEDDFTCYRRLREQGINEHLGLQVYVSYAFRDYALDLARCYRFDEVWEDISLVYREFFEQHGPKNNLELIYFSL